MARSSESSPGCALMFVMREGSKSPPSLTDRALQREPDEFLRRLGANDNGFQQTRRFGRFVVQRDQRVEGFTLRISARRPSGSPCDRGQRSDAVAHLDNQPFGRLATDTRNAGQG